MQARPQSQWLPSNALEATEQKPHQDGTLGPRVEKEQGKEDSCTHPWWPELPPWKQWSLRTDQALCARGLPCGPLSSNPERVPSPGPSPAPCPRSSISRADKPTTQQTHECPVSLRAPAPCTARLCCRCPVRTPGDTPRTTPPRARNPPHPRSPTVHSAFARVQAPGLLDEQSTGKRQGRQPGPLPSVPVPNETLKKPSSCRGPRRLRKEDPGLCDAQPWLLRPAVLLSCCPAVLDAPSPSHLSLNPFLSAVPRSLLRGGAEETPYQPRILILALGPCGPCDSPAPRCRNTHGGRQGGLGCEQAPGLRED